MMSGGKGVHERRYYCGFGANPGFGIYGGATNTIFGFIRAVHYCFHWWESVTYLQKDNKKISINEAKD
jgi:hypothetical protein